MRVCNLTSGSDGNSTYIETENVRVLLDIGLSCLQIENKLKQIDVDAKDIDVVIISHEHSDHIKGLSVFLKKYKAKVLVHSNGINAVYNKTKDADIKKFVEFSSNEFMLRDLKVTPFILSHDSVNNCGFMFENNNKKFAFLTDLGFVDSSVLSKIYGCDTVFIESNHDEKMLMANPNYSLMLKHRILSNKGHLSNISCARAILELIENNTKQFLLCHLSTKNNTRDLAFATVRDFLSESGKLLGEDYALQVCSLEVSSFINF